jgi:hypothetical protein
MANLIVKPTSGGNLILQDEGGDAALTIDTLGNSTLAGTANDLGTISTATVFPSGHVAFLHVIENGTRTIGIADNTTYTWGTFTKKQAATTKLMWTGQIIGYNAAAVDRDSSGQFISFESSSLSQKKHRGVTTFDLRQSGAGGGNGDYFMKYTGESIDCVYAETYTVKWGSDYAGSHQFTIWNPNGTDDARITAGKVSALLIWEVII